MPNDPDLEVPTAPGPLQSNPGLKLGLVIGLLTGLAALAGAGGLDDGWQWKDLAVVLPPVITGLGADRLTFSQNQADHMAPRSAQREAVEKAS